MAQGIAMNLTSITAGQKGGVDDFYDSGVEGDGVLRTVMVFMFSGGLEVSVGDWFQKSSTLECLMETSAGTWAHQMSADILLLLIELG